MNPLTPPHHLPLVAASLLVSESSTVTPWWAKVRQVANWVNGSTLAGVVLARWAGVPLAPGPRGVLVAFNYPRIFPAPHAGAVSVGNVVLCRHSPADLPRIGRLLKHEEVHSTQWAVLWGPVGFIPTYFGMCLWSWLRCRNFYFKNPLEQWAGLTDGGYLPQGQPRSSANAN